MTEQELTGGTGPEYDAPAVEPAVEAVPAAAVAAAGRTVPLTVAVLAAVVACLIGGGLGWAAGSAPKVSPAVPEASETANENPMYRAWMMCDAGTVRDGGRTLMLDMKGEDFGTGTAELADLECVLLELETPASTRQKMMATRALDGRQSDDWKLESGDRVEASWSYHPDSGLDVIFELND